MDLLYYSMNELHIIVHHVLARLGVDLALDTYFMISLSVGVFLAERYIWEQRDRNNC